ncbi:MAG: hypothetical protein KDA31_11080 [Phycisphaerales bacterium]|nr:hypothetical protein [Phycisphaerales bacterium]MCB9836864.1 hypothetical protein [Phycisphaera sp.]
MAHVSRRLFMAATPAALVGVTAAQPEERPRAAEPDDQYPVTPSERASEFVGACHVQFDNVKAMLEEDAGLAKASWDWGFGDWETAIGAASHTGRIDIIELLIAHGARPTIFTLATLDRVDALRDLLENVPNVDALEGPHSISLYRHARAGKAERVLEYLEGRGATDTNPFAIEKAEAEPYFGVYTWGAGETEHFEIGWFERMSAISLKRPGFASRNLMPLGDHTFSPAGARHVRMRFDVEEGTPVRLHVPWAGRTRTAERV